MLALLEVVSKFAGPFTFYILRYMTANFFLGAGSRPSICPKAAQMFLPRMELGGVMVKEDGGGVRMPCSKHINAVYTLRRCDSPLLCARFLRSVALRNTFRSQTAQHHFSMTVPT
jgi:hypothetical protein